MASSLNGLVKPFEVKTYKFIFSHAAIFTYDVVGAFSLLLTHFPSLSSPDNLKFTNSLIPDLTQKRRPHLDPNWMHHSGVMTIYRKISGKKKNFLNNQQTTKKQDMQRRF